MPRRIKSGQQRLAAGRKNFIFFTVLLTGCGSRQERYSGVCTRSFYVGDVKPEDVKAKYESGVLTVVLPKEDARKLPSESKIAIE